MRTIRECTVKIASSLLGIILADFRFLFRGVIYGTLPSLLFFALTAALFASADKSEVSDAILEGAVASIVSLESGKLHYEILRNGEGQQVQSYNSPLVRLKKEQLNEREEILALDEAISGLKLGILGMKEGEIRKLYIHPDLGCGKESLVDPQNALLIFEVEVIEADASSDAHAASNPDSLPIFRDLDDIRPITR